MTTRIPHPAWYPVRATGALLILLAGLPLASAAPITWNTPQPIVVHETDPSINWTPTSCSLFKSTDLNHWTRMGWISREWVPANGEPRKFARVRISIPATP